MQPPIAGKVVLDGIRRFVRDVNWQLSIRREKVIGTTVIYPTAPTTPQKIKARDLLKKIIPKYHISLISLETELLPVNQNSLSWNFLKEIPEQVQYDRQ